MRTPAAPPYLLPPDDVVRPEPWQTHDGATLADRLDHWDPFTDIDLERTVAIDLDLARESCQLGPDATFALCATWRSDRTRLSGTPEITELGTLEGTVRAPLALSIPGASAGGRVDLVVRLVLRSAGNRASPISPSRPGATLWTDSTRVALEGGAARFPVAAIDFSTTPRFSDRASWALEWNPEDLEAPVLSALRLLVNANDPQLLGALRTGSSDARSAVIRSFVTFDVARALVHAAFANERFTADPEAFDEATVGRMLFDLVTAAWPGVPVATLRSRSVEDPSRIDADLQAHMQVFG